MSQKSSQRQPLSHENQEGTKKLDVGTLKLPALNKATHYSLEKYGSIETSGNTWKKTDGEERINNK